MLTSRRRLALVGLVAVLLVGALPAPVLAHIDTCAGSVSPSSLVPGSDTQVRVRVQNISGPTMTWIKIARPNAHYTILGATVDDWSAQVGSDNVVLTNGSLDGDGLLTVWLTVRAVQWQSSPANWSIRASDSSVGADSTDCPGAHSTTIRADMPPEGEGVGISDVNATAAAATATIHWQSDTPTGSGVSYGDTSDYGSSTVYINALTTNHTVTVTGLSPETTYHFQVAGLDGGGTPIYSGDNTFITLAVPPPGTGGTDGNGGTGSPGTTTVPVSQLPAPSGTVVISSVPTEAVAPIVVLDTHITRPVAVSPALTGTATDNVAVARIDYSLDGGQTWVVVSAPAGIGSKKATYTFTPGALEDGNYNVMVRATDTSGNVANTAGFILVIDRLPPRVVNELVAFGSQVITPSAAGSWKTVEGINHTITLKAVGGPTRVVVTATKVGVQRVSQSFALQPNSDSGLWMGVMTFRDAGSYRLAVETVDGAQNEVTQHLSEVKVVQPGRLFGVDGQAINGVTVTLYGRQEGQQDWQQWDGGAYGQSNPYRSQGEGSFAWLIPKGIYYIKMTAPGYRTLITSQFEVDQVTPVAANIQLTKRLQLRLGSWTLAAPEWWPSETAIELDAAPNVGSPSIMGEVLSNQRLSTTRGDTASLVGLQGRPTLVTTLATWAPATAEQLPELAAIRGREMDVTPLFSGEHLSQVRTSLARGGYELGALVDSQGLLTAQLGVQNLPTHYVIDRNGRVKTIVTGVLSSEELAELFRGW